MVNLLYDTAAAPWYVGALNAVLNTLQVIVLAYIAARYRSNGR